MSPIQWALQPLKKYAQFSGRASRAEFWWFMLFVLIAYFVMMFLFAGMGMSMSQAVEPGGNPAGMLAAMGGFGIVLLLFWLAMIIPTTAVQVRRLHDSGRSGWWIGGFWLLYLVYMVSAFSMAAGAVVDPSNPTPPSMAGLGVTMILGLVMFVLSIVLLIFYCLPGTNGPNAYGPDPYGHDEHVGDVFA